MGELYDEYLKKRKKNKKRIADEWNEENPDQKISKDDLAPVRTTVKSDDLAPVRTTSGKWYEDWLDKPKAFSDGLDLFDIHKTILGSGKDVEHNIAKGILKAGEGILDAGTFAAGKISEAFGNEKFAEKAYTFQQRDLVEETKLAEKVLDKMHISNPAMKLFELGNEENSVFAEKSDSLVQSAGQLGAAMGLQSVGVPWWATMGTSAFGQSSGEAMKQGATSNEAAAYGAISAGAEVLSEKLFGGIKFGGKTLDEGAKKLLANAISNKTASTLVRFGFDAAGEGFEEVVADVASRIGEKLTFGDEKTWNELLTSEEAANSYIESFVGGAVMGGGFNAGRVGKSLKTGRDYDTGFSSNEQSIIDKEINKRSGELQKEAAIKAEVERRISSMDKGANVTEAEKRNIRRTIMEEMDNGTFDSSQTKLSKKEASEIEKQVVEDFKKGFFDIDTIEGTLMEAETAKISELKEQKSKTTNEAKQAEIQREIDRLTLEKNKKMKELVSGDYWLQESYRQELLKGKAFAREAKDTDTDITKELAESAKAAGMNNTRKMHELFDYTNKIANDTDTKYGFTNSKQLKDMGYSMEDATINGMVRVQADGSEKVLINVDSGKALNTIIGHETTHLLEGTQEHKDLVAAVKEYAEMKGEYDGRFKAVTELYQNVDANIENEVTADLVGDYIFTDEQFVMELTKKPNVFQKVYDYIKHAYKMATAGSSEARQLLKAKRAFEKAYKNMKPSTENNSVRYELEKYSDHQLKNWENSKKIVVYKDEQHLVDFVNESKQENAFKKMYFGTIPESLAERVLNDTGIDVRGRNVALASYEVKKIFKSHGNEEKEQSRGQRAVEVEDFVYIKEVIESPDDIKLSDETYEGHPVIIFTKSIGGDVAVVTYDVDPQNDLRVQTVYMNKNATKKRSLATVIDGEPPNITSETASGTASKDIISRNAAKNNGKFSISDNQGRELSKGQQEYFKDSKVRDENGNLKVMYHGTASDFTIFDTMVQGGKNGTAEGYGIYFTDSEEVAKPYSNNGKLMQGYLNITNPATSYEKTIKRNDLVKLIKTTCEEEARSYVDDGEYDSVEEALKDTWVSNYTYTYDKPMSEAYRDVASQIIDSETHDMGIVQEVMGGLGIRSYESAHRFYKTLKDTLGIDGFVTEWETAELKVGKAQVVLAFDSNQFKNADNENPTDNPDIRYSLSGKDDLAPVGGYAVYGNDVKLNGDLAPVRNIDNDVEDIDPSMFEPWPDEPAAEPVVDYDGTTVPMDKESMRLLTKNMKEVLELNQMQRRVLKDIIQDYSTSKNVTDDDLYNAIADQFSVQSYEEINEELLAVKKALRETPIRVPDSVKDGIKDYFKFRQSNFNKLKLGNSGMEIYDAYEALREVYPGHFPADIINPEDQLYHMAEIASMEHSTKEEYVLPEEKIAEATDFIRESVSDYKRVKKLDASLKWKNPDGTLTRAAVHAGYMQKIKDAFAEKGMDFESVMANGKNLSTFATVDNTPQRVMEKTFGYKEGQLLSDLTVNQAAENETEAIRWLKSFTDKKNGTLVKLSKKYKIKPFSKEDAAAQKYAEGMHVNQYGDYVEYGDRELEAEIKDPQMRANIKAFVADPQLRKIYDETLDAINASRTRNGYAPIPRRNDYFLHFREMDDTFSKIGIPFNPNDIKAKDLPTDINGMTADNKPGQPWFGSSMQRKGVGTTYALLGGMEKYLTAAKPQIFHIDDIQVLRALRNSIADTYGQAKGLERLDEMTDEEAEARIEQVYGAHLSTFAKFLNEEANIMAGKTALIDRGMEGVLGRRAISFMNTLNSQVAKNMIGFNVSSSLTNFVSVTQAAAKASKYDVIKAFAQTTSNKLKSISGEGDGFAEKNSAIVRRKGPDKFYQKPLEKVSDTGFIFMSAIDDISTEFIVRTKYNELTRKGMSEEQAHDEAGKWAMRILGDRSFGQMPQIFNSKTLGLVTKFQLEVRNQLDSMFYDTVQEANVSTEEIKNETARNAVKAAKITSTVAQLAVFQHLFGKAFESVAGYNPTFDIVENLMILCGFDDEEDSEDTFMDNLEEALLGLGEDLPYFSTVFGGGRIPIASALPIEQFVQGKDDYGNDKPRVETLKEAAPYYFSPTGYGQVKKMAGGLKMFDKDLPVSGSYTDSGNLRFPVEATPKNIAQAAVFGQWASENAREYFDGEHTPLKEKQIEEFKELDLPIADYWKIREGMSGLKKNQEKVDYINGLDLPISKKNILANNVVDRKEKVDLTNYDDFGTLEEMDFAVKNPGKYSLSKAVGGYQAYKQYSDDMHDLTADKDENGTSIRGSRKVKVAQYINELDADYGTKLILYKKEYPSDDSYNMDIINYLNEREDITYDEMVQILEELDFTVDADGNVGW